MKTVEWAKALLAPILFASACDLARVSVPSGPPVGQLTKVGPFVRVNGRPAPDGLAIRPGDHVATGEFSSAIIRWRDGSSVQLDENTDPFFEWVEKDPPPPDTLAISIGFGQILVDTSGRKVRVANPFAEVAAGSTFTVSAETDGPFSACLLEGDLRLVKPPGRALRPNECATVSPSLAVTYAQLTEIQRRTLLRRFERFAPGLRERPASEVDDTSDTGVVGSPGLQGDPGPPGPPGPIGPQGPAPDFE